MAQDVEALELLHLELTKLEALNNPPKDSDKIETFQNECSVKIASTQILFQDITAYTKAINDQMEMARKVLDESTAEVQKRIQEIADSITVQSKNEDAPKFPVEASKKDETEYATENRKHVAIQSSNNYGIVEDRTGSRHKATPVCGQMEGNTSRAPTEKDLSTRNKLVALKNLLKVQQKKNNVERSLTQAQQILNDIGDLQNLTGQFMDNFKKSIQEWLQVRDQSHEEEKLRKANEEKMQKDVESKRQEEKERKRREAEERKREEQVRKELEKKSKESEERLRKLKKNEERKKKEDEKKRKKVEERRQQEDERRMKVEEKQRQEERKRKENEERRRKEEKRKRQEEEKRKEEEEKRRKEEERIKEEERKKKIEEDRNRLEEEEKKRQEERRRKEEEERKRKEEESKRKEEEEIRRKEEEDRKQKEAEQRRKEEEERWKLNEEARMRKESDEMRKREKEAERRRQEQIRLDEEEKRRKEAERRKLEEEKRRREEEKRKEIERKKREEEERKIKLDPYNWDTIRYTRSDGEVDGARKGLCCIVSAIRGSLKADDLECVASDEDKPEEITGIEGDIPASSMVQLTSKSGRIDTEAPSRVFVPCIQVDSNDEIVILCSVDGGYWQEKVPIYQPGFLKNIKNRQFVATEINQFKEAKIIVVARTKSEDIIVDKPGLVHQSSIDKNVKLNFPENTFKEPTKVKLQIRHIPSEHVSRAAQQYENCENVLSTSQVVTVICDGWTNMDVSIDITRVPTSDARLEKGTYYHVYRGNDKQWYFTDAGAKIRNQNLTIGLPKGKERYSAFEIEMRKGVQKETVLLAAAEIFNHAHKSVVRLIARQKLFEPSQLMLQCLRCDQVDYRLAELDNLGYNIGPGTSREFCLSDGQKLLIECKGNIGIMTKSKKNAVHLTYHVYMDSAKQEVSLFVVDERKQRENETYLGLLVFETIDNGGHTTRGELPLTFPKVHLPRLKPARTSIRFQHYLSALCRYLGWRLTQDENDEWWLNVMQCLIPKRQLDAVYRRAKVQHEDGEKRKICQTVFENWMKSLPLEDDKVHLILDALVRTGNKELAIECKRFVEVHKVLFSERVISNISNSATEVFASLAAKVYLSSEEIQQLQSQEDDVQVYNLWFKWEQSDDIICRGPEAAQYCLQIIESFVGKGRVFQDLKLDLKRASMKE